MRELAEKTHNDSVAIRKIFSKLLSEKKIHYSFLENSPDIWAKINSYAAYQPVEYTYDFFNYMCLYNTSESDITIQVKEDNKVIGIWPLKVLHGESTKLHSNFGYIYPPYFISGITGKRLRRIHEKLIHALQDMAGVLGLKELIFSDNSIETDRISIWHQVLKQTFVLNIEMKYQMCLGIENTVQEIRSNIRKSYRPLISKGSSLFNTNIMDDMNVETATWDEFRGLHRESSGGITRNSDTWEAQKQAIKNAQAFLCYSRCPHTNKFVGGAFIYKTRDEALYAVAAYDRSLFHLPIGHIIQYKTILYLKEKCINIYRLGPKSFQTDNPEPSEKELAISIFKSGFTSHYKPQYILKVKL